MSRSLFILLPLILQSCQPRPVTEAPPRPVLDSASIALAEAAIEHALRAAEVPGAVLLIGRGDGVIYRKAFGMRALQPAIEPMQPDTVFDLASLTKPVATATAIMKLVDQGRLRVTDRAAQYLPEFGQAGKERTTVEQLLLHTSGLIADNAMEDYQQGQEQAWRRVCELSPQWPPGSRFAYSDVGYIVLGKLVEAVDGRPLDRFVQEEILRPLGMDRTTFHPPSSWRENIAPTELRDGQWLVGQVHDPRAARLGGVAGHAGLFGTADDLARFCRMVLQGGQLEGRRVLSPEAVRVMTHVRCLQTEEIRGQRSEVSKKRGSDCRSYGFDVDTAYSSVRGLRFEPRTTFGHTGFTGTMFWMDPAQDLYVILLTSRLHAPGGGAVQALRKAVMTFAAQAVLGASEKPAVLTGVDVLVEENYATLRGRRVGLITNHTGVDRFGRRTIDLLQHAPGVRLVALFSPEHGIGGKEDREGLAHDRDEKTGLPIYSLYGQTRRPTAAMLRDVDTLVFDIQDIGTRFYTYLTTMGYAMEEAAAEGKRFVVLDRPNPIGPLGPHGPLADADQLSFIAYKPLPLVHGMTLGELARLFQSQYIPRLDLQVVKMKDYRRDMWWEDTGVAWINPSPNMRSPTEALLYPAIGLLEMTNLSVGRGTDTPFELVGAPWLEGEALAAALNGSHLPGVRFEPVRFTPESSKHAGQACSGVRIVMADRAVYDPVRTGLTIAWHLRRMYGPRFESDKILKMLASAAAQRAWQETQDSDQISAGAIQTPQSFLRARSQSLIYPQ